MLASILDASGMQSGPQVGRSAGSSSIARHGMPSSTWSANKWPRSALQKPTSNPPKKMRLDAKVFRSGRVPVMWRFGSELAARRLAARLDASGYLRAEKSRRLATPAVFIERITTKVFRESVRPRIPSDRPGAALTRSGRRSRRRPALATRQAGAGARCLGGSARMSGRIGCDPVEEIIRREVDAGGARGFE